MSSSTKIIPFKVSYISRQIKTRNHVYVRCTVIITATVKNRINKLLKKLRVIGPVYWLIELYQQSLHLESARCTQRHLHHSGSHYQGKAIFD